MLRGLDAGDRHRFISALRDLAEATGDQGGNLAVAFRDIEILKINGNRLSDGIKSRVRCLLLGPGRYTAGGGKKKDPYSGKKTKTPNGRTGIQDALSLVSRERAGRSGFPFPQP